MKKLLSAILVASIGLTTVQGWAAGNTRIESFNQAKKLLEQKVYFDHRETFYCRATFDSKKNVKLPEGFTTQKHEKRAHRVEWEHVVITKLNEQMGQEIAAAGNGMYVRADNTNSALKALQKEIEKMNKTELDSKVYSEYDEQFQIFAWIALFLLIADFMTLDRKNHIFRKVKLFS